MTLLKYILALIFLTAAFLVIRRGDYLPMIAQVTVGEMAASIFFCLTIFWFSGFKIAVLTATRFGKKLRLSDILTLPLMMNFWSFIVPFKGGMLFQVLFLKMKYQIKAVAGASISMYTQLITLVLYGLIGICYFTSRGEILSLGTAVSVLLTINPLVLFGLEKLLKLLPRRTEGTLARIQGLIHSTLENHSRLWADVRTFIILLLLAVGHTIMRVVWIYFAARAFGIAVPFITVLAMAILTEVSVIIRFVPGNLGVYELLSGGMFHLLGSNAETGILIALFLRVTTLIVTATIGWGAVNANMKYFQLHNFKAMWEALKQQSWKS